MLLNAACCAAAAPAVDDDGAIERRRYSRTLRETLPWTATQTIEITEAGGNITLHGADKDKVTLKGIRTCFHPELSEARARVNDVMLNVQSRPDALSLSTRLPAVWIPDAAGQIDYIAGVPAVAPLRLFTVSGDIEAHGITAHVSARSTSGSIIVGGAGGGVDARTATGDVIVSRPRGPVTIDAATGAVTLRLDQLDGSPIHITTLTGPVYIEIESDIDAEFIIQTALGAIHTDTEKPRRPPWNERTVIHKIGQGTNKVFIRTISGDITIERTEDEEENK